MTLLSTSIWAAAAVTCFQWKSSDKQSIHYLPTKQQKTLFDLDWSGGQQHNFK